MGYVKRVVNQLKELRDREIKKLGVMIANIISGFCGGPGSIFMLCDDGVL